MVHPPLLVARVQVQWLMFLITLPQRLNDIESESESLFNINPAGRLLVLQLAR